MKIGLGAVLLFALAIAGVAALIPTQESNDARAAETPRTISVREFLSNYWGPKWPELEAQVPFDQRPRLEDRIDPSSIPKWESVEPMIREEVLRRIDSQSEEWISSLAKTDRDPDLESDEFNPDRIAFSAEDRKRIEAVLSMYDSELNALAQLAYEAVREADQEAWDSHRYSLSPILQFGPARDQRSFGSLTIMRSFAAESWCIWYTIDSSSVPQLAAVMGRIEELRAQRASDVLSCVNRLRTERREVK